MGEGGACHLRDLLDGRPVPASALYVYHQETTVGSPEDRAWIEREDRVRSIIPTPAMLLVWILGLMLAFHLDAWMPGLVPRQACAGRRPDRLPGVARRIRQALANGERPLSGKALRMINEIPGIAAALIVVLVIVRPF